MRGESHLHPDSWRTPHQIPTLVTKDLFGRILTPLIVAETIKHYRWPREI